jgi:hypothetical protein
MQHLHFSASRPRFSAYSSSEGYLRAISRKCQHLVYPNNKPCLVPVPCFWKFGTIACTKDTSARQRRQERIFRKPAHTGSLFRPDVKP